MNSRRLTIDLNCDMGELPHLLADGTEEALMQEISSANIACGAHAGDVESMQVLVRLAKRHGVAVGAHISYPDRANFGRKDMAMGAEEIEEASHSQISLLAKVAAAFGVRLNHVKPHGALYHAAQKNELVAAAIANAASRIDKKLILLEQASSPVLGFWFERGHRVVAEGFADRTYEIDGSLRSRDLPQAVTSEPWLAAEQAVRIARDHAVLVGNGSLLHLEADTICIHGDTPSAVQNARSIKSALHNASIKVAAINVS